MSSSEVYAFYLQNEEPNNYSRIPNILGHLEYEFTHPKTGIKSIKKLSVYARELYRVIKQTAGEENCCWKTIRHLAEEAGMSPHAAIDARKELERPCSMLGGESLIVTTKHQKATTNAGIMINKTTYHKTVIVNIWGYNNAFFKMRKIIAKEQHVPNGNTPDGACSPQEHAPQGACSHSATKQDPCINIPLSNEQHPTAEAVPVVSDIKKERLFPCEKKRSVYLWLIKEQCSEPIAYKISITFSFEEVESALRYLKKQREKKTVIIKNKWAYLQNILNNKFWEKL